MVALVIIYNHRFDKNITLLEKIYQSKFSHIFHLMPFYDRNKENVIPVYENSHYFQGYIAQAYKILKEAGNFEHFLFIGDDLLLNPEINENNYQNHFSLTKGSSFFPKFENVSERPKWMRSKRALSFSPNMKGLETTRELPSREEILEQFSRHNLEIPFLKRSNKIKPYLYFIKYKINTRRLFNFGKLYLEFPLVTGYSDIIIIDKGDMERFAHFCGVFSAGKLFVETAIPSAMVMACKKIKTEDDTIKKGLPLWKEDRFTIEKDNHNSLNHLYTNFPKEILYIHPIKISRWKNDLNF